MVKKKKQKKKRANGRRLPPLLVEREREAIGVVDCRARHSLTHLLLSRKEEDGQ